MPIVKIDPALFDAFNDIQFPSSEFEYVNQLDTLTQGLTLGDMRVLQVSSSLIRLEQDFVSYTDPNATETYELRLEGSGIGPVSSLQALIDAVNSGLATGAVSHLGVVFDDGAAGVEVLSVDIGANGYVVASGAQSLLVGGTLPLTFEDLSDFLALAGRALTINDLTRDERKALFADLGAYGVQDFAWQHEGDTYFGLNVDATEARLSILGLTFALSGTFPDNFGEDLQLLWQISRLYLRTGDPLAVAEFALGAFAIDGFRMMNAAGQVLVRIADPLDGSPMGWKVDGQTRDDLVLGTLAEDKLVDAAGVSSAMAGLWGDDVLRGLGKSDHLMGGLGQDLLEGGAGRDILSGGGGRDKLVGGAGADVFQFDRQGGSDRITDFELGVDKIAIRGAGSSAELAFTQIDGDVLIEFGRLEVLIRNASLAEVAQDGNFLF